MIWGHTRADFFHLLKSTPAVQKLSQKGKHQACIQRFNGCWGPKASNMGLAWGSNNLLQNSWFRFVHEEFTLDLTTLWIFEFRHGFGSWKRPSCSIENRTEPDGTCDFDSSSRLEVHFWLLVATITLLQGQSTLRWLWTSNLGRTCEGMKIYETNTVWSMKAMFVSSISQPDI